MALHDWLMIETPGSKLRRNYGQHERNELAIWKKADYHSFASQNPSAGDANRGGVIARN